MVSQPPRKNAFLWLRCLLRFVVLVVLFAGFGVLVGIPGPWVIAWINQQQTLPGHLEMGDLVWRPRHGWSVEEVVWYSPKDLTRPFLKAEQVQFHVGIDRKVRSFRVGNGTLSTELGMWTGKLGVSQPLLIENLEGGVDLDETHLTFQGVRFKLSGIQVDLKGRLERSTPTDSEPDSREEPPLLERFSRNLIPVIQGLESYSSTTEPVFHVKASGKQGNPTLAFHLMHPEAFDLRGNTFSSLIVRGKLEDRVMELSEVVVRTTADEKLSAQAELDFRERMFELSLENTLDREALEAISPFSIDTLLSTIELRLEGEAAFSMQVGPTSFDRPGDRVKGSFQLQDASFRDAFFSKGSFQVDWHAPYLRLPEFSGTMGFGEQAGNIEGNMELHTGTGMLRLNLEGAADPAQAVSLVGAEVESLIREWEFQGPPPEFRLEVDLPEENGPVNLNLIARAEDAVWRGTLFHTIRAVTSLNQEGLRIRDVTATRAAHLLEGNFTFPPDLSSCTFTVESNFPLPDVLPLLGQRAVDVVRSVRFLGPTRFSASGTADLTDENDHDLSGNAVLEKVAMNWVWFEKLSSPFVLKGQSLDLPEIKGETVGGTLEAELRMRDVFVEEGRFETDVSIEEVDLFQLVTRATDSRDTPYTGILRLELVMKGALYDTLETRRATTFAGEGTVQIREGELFRIPLLLGLSSILNKVTKGFGYASQGDLDADFVIQEGQLSTKNLLVGGSVMSIAGTGGYNFDSQEISGNVKVQLLKDGVMSDALKVLLWPIRKLIEVSLTGTLDNLDWRPRNLPKELFGK